MLSGASRTRRLGRAAATVAASSPLCAQRIKPRRCFHATAQREIVPFVAAAVVVGLLGRYSFRALRRMDAEREDYQWALLEYDKAMAKHREASGPGSGSGSGSQHPLTLGIDVGTIFWKLAMANYSSSSTPTIVETPERHERLRFAGITIDESSQTFLTAKLDDLFYDPSCRVVLPYAKMAEDAQSTVQAASLISHMLVPAVEQALERAEAEMGIQKDRFVRTVLTMPPQLYETHASAVMLEDDGVQDGSVCCLPDPVATVWGAKAMGIIDADSEQDVVVLDVGGLATHMTVVGRKATVVTASHTLSDVGGETIVKRIVDTIWEIMEKDMEGEGSRASLSYLRSDPTTLATVTQHARTAAHSLVRELSTTVHIPYLYMGVRGGVAGGSANPNDFHFSANLTRAQITSGIDTDAFTSTLTQVLEMHGGPLPSTFLLVGGGARHAVYKDAAIAAVQANVGSHVTIKESVGDQDDSSPVLVIPSESQELTAIGAATLLPNYTYAATHGLERMGREEVV